MNKFDIGERSVHLPQHVQSNYETVGQGSNFVFLSLYLLLLAFFIFLVSISEIEQTKSNKVLESVRETFPGKSWVQPINEIPQATKTGNFNVQIKGLFEPVLGDKGTVINGQGEFVLVKINASLLFDNISKATFTPIAEGILDRISDLLIKKMEDGRRPFLSIIIGDQTGQTFEPNKQTTPMTRLEKIVSFLLNQGAIKKTVSIGLDDQRSDDQIHFQFRLKHLVEPSLNLEKVGPA